MAGPAEIVYFLDKEKVLIRSVWVVAEGAFSYHSGAMTEFFRLPCGHFIRVAHPTDQGLGVGDIVFGCSGMILVTGSARPHGGGAVYKLSIDYPLVTGIAGRLVLNLLTLRPAAQLLLMAWAADLFFFTGMEGIFRKGGRGRVKLF